MLILLDVALIQCAKFEIYLHFLTSIERVGSVILWAIHKVFDCFCRYCVNKITKGIKELKLVELFPVEEYMRS